MIFNNTMLYKLIIGDISSCKGDLLLIMQELNKRLRNLEILHNSIKNNSLSQVEIEIYSPYIGRAYLETSLTAILVRFDSIRVLFTKRHQDADYYETNERSKSAIQWTGDILSPTSPGKHPWATNTYAQGNRSLLGHWANELIWSAAFEDFSDWCSNKSNINFWYSELLLKEPNDFCIEIRNKLDGLFSKFSKGIHSELLNPRHYFSSSQAVYADYKQLCQNLTYLALLSHFNDHFICKLSKDKAFNYADKISGAWL